MILAQTEEGKLHVIESWDVLHLDKKIVKLILTDGKFMHSEISGCDNYYINREGIASHRGANIVKEEIFGIRNIKPIKDILLKDFNEKLKTIMDSNKPTEAGKHNVKEKMAVCSKNYDKMLKIIEKESVIHKSLIIEEEKGSRKDFKLEEHKFKGGCGSKLDIRKILGKNYRRYL